jgi:glucose/arabinose dehydrogenase
VVYWDPSIAPSGMARIRDGRNGPDGYLYILTDEKNGKLLRLEPND